MKKLVTLIFVFISLSVFSQNGNYKGWGFRGDILGVSTNSIGSIDNTSWYFATNNTKVGKVDSIGRFLFGAATNSLGSSALHIARFCLGTGTVDIGQYTAGRGAIWITQNTPTNGNYALASTGNTTYVNGTNATGLLQGGSVIAIQGGAFGYNTVPYRFGSSVAPSATLDVTGTAAFSQSVTVAGRFEKTQGADVASATGSIALGFDGNVFEVTGTNAMTLIQSAGWQNGSEITLIFTSTASLTDGTANSGTLIGMELAGNANFTGSADDLITLVLCEMGGVQRWREKCRSVN